MHSDYPVIIALCTKSNGRYDIKAEKRKNYKVKEVINQIFAASKKMR